MLYLKTISQFCLDIRISLRNLWWLLIIILLFSTMFNIFIKNTIFQTPFPKNIAPKYHRLKRKPALKKSKSHQSKMSSQLLPEKIHYLNTKAVTNTWVRNIKQSRQKSLNSALIDKLAVKWRSEWEMCQEKGRLELAVDIYQMWNLFQELKKGIFWNTKENSHLKVISEKNYLEIVQEFIFRANNLTNFIQKMSQRSPSTLLLSKNIQVLLRAPLLQAWNVQIVTLWHPIPYHKSFQVQLLLFRK